MDTISLQNETLILEFSKETGALVGLTARKTGWKILDRPHLGLSFRLLVPLSEELRNNPVHGEKQQLAELALAPDGNAVTFAWEDLTSERGGRLDIALQMRVTLDDEQAVFAMAVDNRSPYVIENVYVPYLGDIQHPQNEEWFKTFIHSYAAAGEWNLWPKYDNLRGYFGFDFPVQFHHGVPLAPFILLRGEKQGLYIGAASNSAEVLAWHTELRPGFGSSINHLAPKEQMIAGKDVATRFAAVHVPYIQPGETRKLTPIAVQPYQGGWQHGADIYKRWRNTWFQMPVAPDWVREPHAWQQIHINSPEDELRMPFKDLIQVGAECAKHGVKAIQLVGWNDGGQDQGNPSHTPDPRLGTFEELSEAIAQIQALGVKVILFSKFTWADRGTEWFREQLHRLAVKDPYGDYYVYPGYQYQTATQALDINTKRLIPMCFSSHEYLELCNLEFQKTVNLGADGILFDECQHHGPAILCFDEQHGHRYGAPVYANDRVLIQNFHAVSDTARSDFLFAGEACYDWEMDAYHLAYFRSENKEHIPLSRYLLPDAQFMTAVTGFNDRNMINQCLLYRYIISYEPFNFKGRLTDFPDTLAYGKKMDALRLAMRDYFWDGEYRDTLGAAVTQAGQLYKPYSVFINRKNGKSGVVIANYSETRPATVDLVLDSGEELRRYRLVDEERWRNVEQGILIPPMSAVVVIE